MTKVRIVVWVVACALVAFPAGAQPILRRGASELSLHVAPDVEGAVGDMIYAQAGYGRFLRDRLALRATASYALLEDVAGEDNDYKSQELGLAAEYHFVRGAFVPYIGLGIGWRSTLFGDLDESALVYGPRVGVKYFLADNVALDLEVTYKLAGADVFINDFAAEDTDLTPTIGLRVLF